MEDIIDSIDGLLLSIEEGLNSLENSIKYTVKAANNDKDTFYKEYENLKNKYVNILNKNEESVKKIDTVINNLEQAISKNG